MPNTSDIVVAGPGNASAKEDDAMGGSSVADFLVVDPTLHLVPVLDKLVVPESRQIQTLRSRREDGGTSFVSVALFFNLADPAGVSNAPGYRATDSTAVDAWLRIGQTPTTSEFMRRYWRALSYGNFEFGVDANRDAGGRHVIPTITPANNDGADWGNIATQIVQANPQRVWELSGSSLVDGVRVIPSVVVVQRYEAGAHAIFRWDFQFTVGGATYRVADLYHIAYNLGLGTMAHEYAHNFIEGADLYGGVGGKVAYWDLLGDASGAGQCSDVTSFYKQRLGWLDFNAVLSGPRLAPREIRLRPYASSGDALKIVPDPVDNADEYFLLEFRTATVGDRTWTPDAALRERGLLIVHINNRLGDGGSGTASSSPFMDIEEADGHDGKCWLPGDRSFCDLPYTDRAQPRTGRGDPGASAYPPNNWPSFERPTGVLFPFSGNDSFTPTSRPNSGFYGGRPSGLSITGIRIEGNEAVFSVAIDRADDLTYTLTSQDTFYYGDFDGDGLTEILAFNGTRLALVDCEQNQFHVMWQASERLAGWRFNPGDQLAIGDFDGDGRDDVFIKSAHWAGLMLSDGRALHLVWMTGDPAAGGDWIGPWHLGAEDRVHAGDFDGDGFDDILVVSGKWAGILSSTGRGFDCTWISGDPAANGNWIGGWRLNPGDRHYVGDFNGDGRADVFIRSDHWAALLLSNGHGFDNVWMTGDPAANANWIGGWRLNPGDRHVVLDFDGDGRDDIFVRSDEWAALLRSNGDSLGSEWISGDPAQGWNWIWQWRLQAGDREGAGLFNYDRRGDVFAFRPGEAVGLFLTDQDSRSKQHVPGLAYRGDRFPSKPAPSRVDQLYIGRFTGRAVDDVLAFNGERLVLFANTDGDLNEVWRSAGWLGGWHLGPHDRLYVGDFDGDGRDDVFIRSPSWAGLLLSTGSGFECVWMTGDPSANQNWIGGWRLGTKDRHYIGDFDGDGRADVFIRSPLWAGLLRSTGRSFELAWISGDPGAGRNWVGGWHLGPGDRHVVGDFDGDGRSDVFIQSADWAGMLISTGDGFDTPWMTGPPEENRNWIGRWRVGPHDRGYAGDFDGDGADELFIRSNRWAGLLSYGGGRLDSVWMTGNPAENRDWVGGWRLGRLDRHIVGDFNGDGRADVFVRSDRWAGMLLSSGTSFDSTLVLEREVDAWVFNAFDRQLAGRLTGAPCDEILVSHPGGWSGTLTPEANARRLSLSRGYYDRITAR